MTEPTFRLPIFNQFVNKSFDNTKSYKSMDRSTPQTLRLTSTPQSVSTVVNYMEGVSKKCCLSPDLHFDVVTCVTEAVNNAIIHGNCRDARKAVQVKVQQKKNILAVHVSDEGTGFDYKQVPDPTSPECIENIGGRGVFLMKQLSHRIAFKNNGSTVEMEFKL
jgi:serine/threonine-protein kinase RsbW